LKRGCSSRLLNSPSLKGPKTEQTWSGIGGNSCLSIWVGVAPQLYIDMFYYSGIGNIKGVGRGKRVSGGIADRRGNIEG
jgi:hypothetical protein